MTQDNHASNILNLRGLSGYDRLLQELGTDPAEFYVNGGVARPELARPDFGRPDAWISVSHANQLLDAAAEATQTREFGLLLGQRHQVDMLGLLGALLGVSKNIAEVLRHLQKYLPSHSGAGAITIEVNDNNVAVRYLPKIGNIQVSQQLIDLTLSSGFAILKQLAGKQLQPQYLYLSYPQDSHCLVLEQIFQCPISFSAGANAVILPKHVLQLEVQTPTQTVKQVLEQHVSLLSAQHGASGPISIERAARQVLDNGDLSLRSVSLLLGMSQRKVQRLCQSEGFSFRAISQKVRMQRALELLVLPGQSVSRVAENLGYSDVSAFSRAFQRFYGRSPTQHQLVANAK